MDIVGFERRVISYVIDAAIAFILSFVVYYYLSRAVNIEFFTMLIWMMIFEIIIFTIINTLLIWATNGVSLGQAIVRSRIKRFDNKRLTLKESFMRSALISIPLIVALNAIYMIAKHTEISIFDQLTNTKVVAIRS